MNRKSVLGVFFVAAIVAGLTYIGQVSAQKRPSARAATNTSQLGIVAGPSLLVDDFTATAGTPITSTGWSAHSAGGTNPIVTSAPSLTISGYPSSGVGNAVALATSGEDDNKPFPVQTTGAVYAAFMVNTSEASVDPAGGYFFHLGPNPVGTTFRGRVFIKKDASNNVAFGLSKAATAAADIVFTGFTYSLNTTYLVVVKYTIVDGTTNDTVNLFVSTDFPASEPAPTLTATDVATQSDISPATVSLRQGSTATAPTVRVDGIRVAKSWAGLSSPAANRNADFDGDGRTDWALTRNTLGLKSWYIQYNGSAGGASGQFGLSTDQVAPADYDGDGKTDIAVWREAPATQAAFYILQSSTATVRTELFGQTGDQPTTVADYDGDGKADVSVYRPGATAGAQSFFYYRGSLSNPGGIITYVPWGINGDTETVGDFDGDGKGDFCVRRDFSGQGVFILLRSSDLAVEYVAWGVPTDTIVPGDYDADGRSDFALARIVSGAGHFFILERDGGGTGGSPIIFGNAAIDFLAPGDYDGDGRTDIAIWRPDADPAQNYFWVRQASNGAVYNFEWGQAGDEPVAEWNVTGGN